MKPQDLKTLKSLLEVMRENKVKRCNIAGFEVELSDAAFAGAETQTVLSPEDVSALSEGEEVCVCGHPLGTQHGALGCLHGCPVSVCETRPTSQPKE